MPPSRSHRSHPDIFARPLIPFREKPETSSSSTEPTSPPSYLQRRYGLNEEIFERRALSKARKPGQKEEQREGHNDTDKGVVCVGSRLFAVESASGSAPDDNTTRTFPVERRTTSAAIVLHFCGSLETYPFRLRSDSAPLFAP